MVGWRENFDGYKRNPKESQIDTIIIRVAMFWFLIMVQVMVIENHSIYVFDKIILKGCLNPHHEADANTNVYF